MLGLLIDFDDTLVHTGPLRVEILRLFLVSQGIEDYTREPGRSSTHILAELFPGKDTKALSAEYQNFQNKYLEEHPPTAGILFPDTIDFLSSLKVDQVVVTTSTRESLRLIAVGTGLLDYVDIERAVTKEDLPKAQKPSPEPYLLGAKRLGLAPQDCVAVEDSQTGIASALAADCKTILINRDKSDIPIDLRSRVLAEVTSFGQLLNFFQNQT